MRPERAIIIKDWRIYYQVALLFTLGLLLTVLFYEPRGVWNKSVVPALLCGAAFGICQMAMAMERDHGTMDRLLLGLPIRPRNMVLAKYVSVYTMTIFMVHIPALFVGSIKDVIVADAIALSAATLCATPSVLFAKRSVQMIPMWGIVLYWAIPDGTAAFIWPPLSTYLDLLAAHPLRAAGAALAACPVVAVLSAYYYEWRSFK